MLMIHSKLSFAFLCSGALILFAPNSAALAAGFRTVAFSGQYAPGTPAGTNFWYFNDPPVVNGLGQTAFKGALTNSAMANIASGIWTESNGSLRLVAGAGLQGPNAPTGVSPPVLNAAGQLAFYGARGDGIGGVDSGAWIEQFGSLSLIALDGNPAPGTAGGVSFHGLINGLVLLNASGHTAFKSFVAGNGINDTNDIGLWSTSSGSLALVAREGDPAPDAPLGALFNSLSEPVMNDAGSVAFAASTTGGVFGIWSGVPGNVHLLIRDGVDAPGTGSGVKFGLGFNEPSLNGAGQIAFTASLAGNGVNNANDRGVWAQGAGGLELIARKGSPAPGTGSGVVFAGLHPPVINAVGETAFNSGLSGTGVDSTNNTGIWAGISGNLDLIVRSGTQASGTPVGAKYDHFGDPVLNAAGQVAFTGNLSLPTVSRDGTVTGGGGGVDSTNDIGIWATDLNGVLQLIAREGDLLEVAPNDFRKIASLIFAKDTGNGDGRHSGFNDRGQIAFAAFFTDGFSGVFVSNLLVVPEPSACAILAGLVVGLLGECRSLRRASQVRSC
jgi:hypothetical protein